MISITLDKLKKKYPNGQKCRVTYGTGKDKKVVEYTDFKHINWNNVSKITIIYDKKKVLWCEKASENVTRDGVAYKII
jgi:hypothetical protein